MQSYLRKLFDYDRFKSIHIKPVGKHTIFVPAVIAAKKTFAAGIGLAFVHLVNSTFERKPNAVVELIFLKQNRITNPVKLYQDYACQSQTGNTDYYEKGFSFHKL